MGMRGLERQRETEKANGEVDGWPELLGSLGMGPEPVRTLRDFAPTRNEKRGLARRNKTPRFWLSELES